MPDYIRAYVPGGSYFFTVALLERRRHLLTENIDALREAFRTVRNQRPFRIDAIVILPDHLHCLWTFPPNNADFSARWRLIKSDLRARHRAGRTAIDPKGDETRTRHLAAAVLGTYHPRLKRFRRPSQLHPLQPGQTRMGATRRRLAAFELSPIRSVGAVFLELGGADRYSDLGFGISVESRKAGYAALTRPTKLWRIA
jgi:putative transposase